MGKSSTRRSARTKDMVLGALALSLGMSVPAVAQFNIDKVAKSAKKVADAATYSDEEMIVFFNQMSEEMDSQNPVATMDDPYGQRLAALTRGLDNYDGLDLDIKAYLVNDVNAFAMGDGTVRIFAGLMDQFDDNEVRCVIGHEIGHVKLEHSKKRMKSALQADAAVSVASTANNKVARIADSKIGKFFGDVVTAQHSQKAERSSDDYALEFMEANNYDQQACVSAMEKLDAMSGGSGGGIDLLKTHPSPKSRARRMQKKIS